MDIIFDIKSTNDWASSVNKEIEKDYPEYFATNPKIGSDAWWALIEEDVAKGKITHVGERFEDGQLFDSVDIQPLDDDFSGDESFLSQPEYSIYREDFWLDESVQQGKLVQIKSVTICPSGELDENSIYLETEVCVW